MSFLFESFLTFISGLNKCNTLTYIHEKSHSHEHIKTRKVSYFLGTVKLRKRCHFIFGIREIPKAIMGSHLTVSSVVEQVLYNFFSQGPEFNSWLGRVFL